MHASRAQKLAAKQATTVTAAAVAPQRQERQAPSLADAVTTFQRSVGNAAAAAVLSRPTVQRVNYDALDNTQYRISGDANNRTIEVVERRSRRGKVSYVVTGTVTGFNGYVPIVTPKTPPVDLGDWYPRVTHVNGMNVKPKSGIGSAEALLDEVNARLSQSDDSAVSQSAVEVLYTYSAQRGGDNAAKSAVLDVWDCLKGKVQVTDDVTGTQAQIMLDAVKRKQRTTVSAHSRGTIKTDNAVRSAYEILVAQYRETMTKKQAEQRVKADMDAYIQLIYAGNAVSYPSSKLRVTMFVGGKDPISGGVGTYTSRGLKFFSGNKRSRLVKLPGKGHGFTANYAGGVGQEIGADIEAEKRRAARGDGGEYESGSEAESEAESETEEEERSE